MLESTFMTRTLLFSSRNLFSLITLLAAPHMPEDTQFRDSTSRPTTRPAAINSRYITDWPHNWLKYVERSASGTQSYLKLASKQTRMSNPSPKCGFSRLCQHSAGRLEFLVSRISYRIYSCYMAYVPSNIEYVFVYCVYLPNICCRSMLELIVDDDNNTLNSRICIAKLCANIWWETGFSCKTAEGHAFFFISFEIQSRKYQKYQ